MKSIDRNITITHENMKAHFASNGIPVSDLYLWNQYRALVLENERLARLADEADYERTIADFRQGAVLP